MMLMKGWDPAKIVVGLVTNPANGSGFIPFNVLARVVPLMVGQQRGRFGGIMGWEYFNSLPGGRERPWEWAQFMTRIMAGGEQTMAPEVVTPVGQVEAPIPPPSAPPTTTGGGGENKLGKEEEQEKVVVEADADEGQSTGKEAPLPAAFDYDTDGLGDD